MFLPFVMVVVVPRWILRSYVTTDTRWPSSLAETLGHAGGGVVFVVGFSLFAWCVSLFARVGQGTLAPWDPTRRLVALGPYRYVRNPMITGVLTMLIGESLFFGSLTLAYW